MGPMFYLSWYFPVSKVWNGNFGERGGQPSSGKNNVCCSISGTKLHLPCAGYTMLCLESLDQWWCFSCLGDGTDITDD